jgi:hypothetical protein
MLAFPEVSGAGGASSFLYFAASSGVIIKVLSIESSTAGTFSDERGRLMPQYGQNTSASDTSDPHSWQRLISIDLLA